MKSWYYYIEYGNDKTTYVESDRYAIESADVGAYTFYLKDKPIATIRDVSLIVRQGYLFQRENGEFIRADE